MRKEIKLSVRVLTFIIMLAITAFLTMSYTVSVAAAGTVVPDVYWEKSFGGAGADTAYAVTESAYDNSFVFAGTTEDERYVYAVKVDQAGQTLWTKTFGGTYWRNVARAVYQTTDNGFILAGYSKAQWYIGNERIHLVKTDANGNLEWEKRIFVKDGKARANGFGVLQASDGGYIVVGAFILYDQADIYVCKTDSLGNVEWEKSFGGAGWDYAYNVSATKDNGFIVTGHMELGGRKLALIKFDEWGSVEWQENYESDTRNFTGKSIQQTTDGGYVVTGYDGANIFLVKVDATGRKLWEKTYSEGIGYSVEVAKDGGYIISGRGGSAGIIVIRTDKTGNKVWEKTLGTSGASGYSIKQTKDKYFIVSGDSGGNAYLAALEPERESVLEVSSPNVLKDGHILVYTVLKEDGELITTGNEDVKIKVPATGEEIELKDQGADGDMSANDGVYSAWYKVTEANDVDIELYLDGVQADSTTVKVVARTDLVVVTDYQALWDEFENTGMGAGDDEDDNTTPDYYDLLGRLNRYAFAHDGVVFDMSKEITTANGYAKNYANLNYLTADLYDMGTLIDAWVNKVGTATGFKSIAIIGDDKVIPFMRRSDPMAGAVHGEHHYPPEVGGTDGNMTLRTTLAKQIMTDIPYGSYDNSPINTIARPRLDAGVGRIFTDRPDKLIKIIDGYEETIVLNSAERTAVIYSLKPDTVNWPAAVNAGLRPVLDAHMQGGNQVTDVNLAVPPYTAGEYYHYDGTVVNWSADKVATAVYNADVTMYWSHASHTVENTQNNPDLTAANYDAIPEAPGSLLLNTGCHSGYSVSQSGTNPGHYDDTMAASIMEKYITYIAPTTYGYGAEPNLGYHDLMLSRYLENVLNGTKQTVGEALVTSYDEYWTHIDPSRLNNLSTYITYGTILYGLPTQSLEYGRTVSLAAISGPNPAPTPEGSASARSLRSLAALPEQQALTMKVPIEITNYKISLDDNGKALIEIPNGGTQTVMEFEPILPLITKSFLLPSGSQVTDVQLTDINTTVYTEPLDLKTTIPINRTLGPLEGTIELPNPYPGKNFWWSTTEQNGGVLLTISLIPVQYNSATKIAALYKQLEFQVDYTASEPTATIDSPIINGGTGVNVGSALVPVKFNVTGSNEQTVKAFWMVKDPAGRVLESGTKEAPLLVGTNQVDFGFDTLGWTPGPKDLTVAILDTGIIDSKTVQFSVYGIDFTAALSKGIFSPVDTSGEVEVEVRDEQGALVQGLTANSFDLKINDGPREVQTFAEEAPGVYKMSFALGSLTPGVYELRVDCSTGSGANKSKSLYFKYKTDATAPVITATTPAANTADVALNSDIYVKFNEPVTWGGKINKIAITDGVESVKYTARFNDNELIIMPETDFVSNTSYTINIPASAVEDLAWNELAEAYSFSFKTLPNTNAALTELKVGGTKVDGFASNRFTYEVVLPYGTAEVPELTWTPGYSKAKVEISPATGVWGTAELKVTAEDGITTLTYTLKFSVAKNTDATLSELKVGGQTALGFTEGKTACFFILPYGTTELPPITAVPTDNNNAHYVITPAQGVDGKATIVVTAEDGITKKTYTIDFSVARNNDAYLKDLQIDGQTIEGFSTNRFSYVVEVPEGTIVAPEVTVLVNDSGAWVETTQAPTVPGTAVVVVTAADGVTTRLYSVTFSIPGRTDTSLKDLKLDGQTISGFASDKFNYEYVLPPGTTDVPEVSAEVYDAGAALEITQAAGPEGTATITVTAQDGRNSRIYSVLFRVLENDGALLNNLLVDGQTVDSFAPDRLNYEVILPFGTIQIPEVTAEAQDPKSAVSILQAEGLPGTAQVSVVSEDGRITRQYSVSFQVAQSASADLDDLKINGETIEGFSAAQLNYQVVLPSEIGGVPVMTAESADPQAVVVITPALGIPGMAQILVTSSDGRMTKIYTVTFSIEVSSSAALSDLKVNNTTVQGFSTGTLNYEVLLPAGTTEVPEVSAIPVDPEAEVSLTLPDDLSDLATILVTSSDGRLTQTYSISFRVIQIGDASLSDLKVDDITLTGFAPGKLNYEQELAYGTTEVPQVSAVTTDPGAQVSIVQADNVNGFATVVVTSADGRLTRTYTVNFSVEYIAPVISSTLDGTVLPGVEKAFTVATTANSETGKLVRVKVTLADPSKLDKVALFYKEVSDGQYYPLTFDANGIAWYGPSAGFPLGDVISDFKATFNTPGDYGYRLEIIKVGSDEVLASTLGSIRVLNNDATLYDLQVGGNTIAGFSSNQYSYNKVLPYGTTVVPVVTAIATDPKAQLSITQADSVTGTATVVVTAEDSTTQKTYTLNFSVALYTDVTLSDLKVDGTTITGFISSQDSYNVVLPYGTTTVPVVTATPTDANAAIEITQAENVTGTAIVVVKANGMPTKTYNINFSVAPPNIDATLSDLKVGGNTITGFASDQYSYNVVLPYGTTVVPVVTAIATDPKAQLSITQADSVTGTATVVVTAEDGTTKQTYTIMFALAPRPGGGGGGPRDTTGPVVVSTIPAEKHPIDVNVNTPIHIKFDEQIQAGSAINNVTIKAENESIQYSYKIEGVVLKLIPVKELASGMTYTIQIPAGAVKDNSGNGLVNSYSFSFTTKAAGPGASPFKDISKDHWAVNEIVDLHDLGIVSGFPDLTFRPQKQITRAEMAVMVAKALKLDTALSQNKPTYLDASKKHWGYKEIEAATQAGVMIGYGNGLFKPDVLITREELVQVIIRALNYGRNADDSVSTEILNQFADCERIPQWAREAVAEAVEREIVKGISPGVFGAGVYGTRDQAAVLVYRVIKEQ